MPYQDINIIFILKYFQQNLNNIFYVMISYTLMSIKIYSKIKGNLQEINYIGN